MIKLLRFTILLFLFSECVFGQSVLTTKHNLSVSGPGSVKADSESEVCIFCHTPHTSAKTPLWNRDDPQLNYAPYSSSTSFSSPGQPDGASLLCLSCHDGTIALGSVLSRQTVISFNSGITTMPDGDSNLGQDIGNDHPVSFIYNAALAAANGELADPATLTGSVQLKDNKMQCTSCHDPHIDLNGFFLVESNQYSALCLYCHQKNYWTSTTHQTSAATWNGSGNDPWPDTDYLTVSENGCENCHTPHGAGSDSRILHESEEEDNCYDCHNGNVASTNILNEISKLSAHNVANYSQVHDPNEQVLVQTQHVECSDCHNPHASNDQPASVIGGVTGDLEGVSGIDTDGNDVFPAVYEYQVCYRCHADSPQKPAAVTNRFLIQDNVRAEFDISNPSFHPVEGPGVNPDVPSLLPGFSESSIIKCGDCHGNDDTGPAGPHGSIYSQLLKYQYLTDDYTPESPTAYELCYQCHDRQIILNTNNSFGDKVHKTHIVDEDTPCNVCHDPHGISSAQGTATNNSNLVNFDTDIVFKSQGMLGKIEFVDTGNFSGACTLLCHNQNHNNKSY